MKRVWTWAKGWFSTGWRRPVFGTLAVILTLGVGLVWARRRDSSGRSGSPQAAPALTEEQGEEIKERARDAAQSTIEAVRRRAEADKQAGIDKYGKP